MAMKFKKGDKVRQVMSKPIEGVVSGMALDEEGGKVNVHVTWKGEDGHKHGVYLTEEQLEAVSSEEESPGTSATADASVAQTAKAEG
jgi:hypothetical protein